MVGYPNDSCVQILAQIHCFGPRNLVSYIQWEEQGLNSYDSEAVRGSSSKHVP